MLTKYDELKDGLRVRCKIDRVEVPEAIISINNDGVAFVCQNVVGGNLAKDMKGYNYAWVLCDKGGGKRIWRGSQVESLESIDN